MSRVGQVLIALDQLGNAILGGWADETISARCWRLRAEQPYSWLRPAIDGIFFWQQQHCLGAYISERRRAQQPPEYRNHSTAPQPARQRGLFCAYSGKNSEPMNQLWQQEAARLGIPGLAQLVSDMRDAQLELMAHIDALDLKMNQQETATTRLLSGFPADDVDGHRRYHESVIEWRELRNRLVREALTKMVGAGALAAIGWLALAIWQAFRVTVTK